MSSSKKIGVLLGGLSVERDASITRGEAVAAALRQMGHETRCMFVDRDIDVASVRPRSTLLPGRSRALQRRRLLAGLLELQGIPTRDPPCSRAAGHESR